MHVGRGAGRAASVWRDTRAIFSRNLITAWEDILPAVGSGVGPAAGGVLLTCEIFSCSSSGMLCSLAGHSVMHRTRQLRRVALALVGGLSGACPKRAEP